MNEHQVNEQHMTALKALATVGMEISKARNTLTQLQESETEYLVSREKKALERVSEVLEQSRSLVEETNKNYDGILELVATVQTTAGFLDQVYQSFTKYFAMFEKSKAEWERDIENQYTTIESIKQGLRVQAVKIDNERAAIDTLGKALLEKQKKIDSDRGALDRAINRLKEGKI